MNMTERDLNVMQGGLTVAQRAAICFAAAVIGAVAVVHGLSRPHLRAAPLLPQGKFRALHPLLWKLSVLSASVSRIG